VVIVKVHFEAYLVDHSTRRAKAPELLVSLERGGGGGSLASQLEHQLREAVRDGRLRPGTQLPSTRALAAELGISRGLVVAAYAQLGAEGYLQPRPNATPLVAAVAGGQASARAVEVGRRWRYNLRPDLPDYPAFPRDEREALVSYLGRARGVVGNPELTFVCGGFAQAIGLIGGVLAKSGRRRIGVEDPSHVVIRGLAAHSGLEPVPIPVDDEGIDVDALVRAGPDAVLVTPAHQFPTGVVLTPERRARLIAWAESADALIVEDDYDAEFRYDRSPVGALQGLMPDRVLYCGSASKTLAPTLRLGWLVAPPRLVHDLVDQVLFTAIAPPRLEQLAFEDFLSRGELDRHLRRMRLRYRRRRDVLVRALARELPEIEIRGAAAGLYLAAVLPPGSDERRVLEEARERGIAVSGLSDHCMRARREPTLLLGYAVSGEPTIRAAVRTLAEAVAATAA
jgi:GntR family transcriptional regulator / MocR family aminotransferase